MCVILMHGLGADGHDFEDVAIDFSKAALPEKWRFVLPHAPEMGVTVNLGMEMPAWYDILDMSEPRAVDWETVEESRVSIEALMERERAPKLVLAGFSQGAAMALHVGLRRQELIAGIMMMSGYLLECEEHPCPKKVAEVPVGIFHGSDDGVVQLSAGERACVALEEAGFTPTMRVYDGMDHSLCEEEMRDLFEWLCRL